MGHSVLIPTLVLKILFNLDLSTKQATQLRFSTPQRKPHLWCSNPQSGGNS